MSNTPRADRRQAAVVSSWDEGEGKSREKKGGGGWMKKEGGKVTMSNGNTHSPKPTHPHTL